MSEVHEIKRVRIISIIPETKDAKSFILEPIEWKPEYVSGQFLTIIFNSSSGEKRRSYSISSSPELNEPLTITIKRQENGEYSRWMVDKAKEGDVLITSGISGFFTKTENLIAEKIFFLAAGSGITPCYALIKSCLFNSSNKVILIYSNKSENDTIFYHQLNSLHERFSERLKIFYFFSNASDPFKSRINKDILIKTLDESGIYFKEKNLFYVCGPFEYMRIITITLITYGIPFENIKKENFNQPGPRLFREPSDKNAHKVKIYKGEKSFELTVQYPESILANAKKHNITIPYSCENGVCGSCVAKCLTGKIWMAYNEVLTEKDMASGLILTCQSFPIEGDAEIALNGTN